MKMTLIEPAPKRKARYVIEVTFMHGDADHHDKVPYDYYTEAKFLAAAKLLAARPKANADYDAWRAWCDDEKKCPVEVPSDVKYEGERADIRYVNYFYYDEKGAKYEVTEVLA